LHLYAARIAAGNKEPLVRTLHGYRTAALTDVHALGCDDRVLVPDGRVAEVIGLYQADDERVLVLFDCGATKRYVRDDLRLLL
jgi:hypothetical protein